MMKYTLITVFAVLFVFAVVRTVNDRGEIAVMEAKAEAATEKKPFNKHTIKVYFTTKDSYIFVTKQCIDGYWYLISQRRGHMLQMTERKGNLALPIECKGG